MCSLPQLWIRIYGQPLVAVDARPLSAGLIVPEGVQPSAGQFAHLPVSFEELVERLQSFPTVYLEMDGSFSWTGRLDHVDDNESSSDEPRLWRIEGMIYDDGQAVRYIEIKGTIPKSNWQRFVECLNSGLEQLSIEMVAEAQVVRGNWFTANTWSDADNDSSTSQAE